MKVLCDKTLLQWEKDLTLIIPSRKLDSSDIKMEIEEYVASGSSKPSSHSFGWTEHEIRLFDLPAGPNVK